MAKYIKFYLDECGANNHTFFVVGGFYIASDDSFNIKKLEGKIKSNILKIEKSIKEFRMNKEKELEQYTLTNNHNEVKWRSLSLQNKSFLLQNIKNFTQKNLSMTCNLKVWKSKNNKPINLDAIYNMVVFFLVDRTLGNLNYDPKEEIKIEILVDQRKSVPKASKDEKKGIKFEGLEGYIETRMYEKSKFTNLKIEVRQFNSKTNPLIRYADYNVGLVHSMCSFLSDEKKSWDENIDKFFELMHKKISCSCHQTIKGQCEIISRVCRKCWIIGSGLF